MNTKYRNIVVAVIISVDGKILMGKKNPNRSSVYPNCWHLPGGGIEEGETKKETLKREVKEETGIDVKDRQIKMLDQSMKNYEHKKYGQDGVIIKVIMDFYVYQVNLDLTSDETDLKTNNEISFLRWFEKSKLKSVELTPPSIHLFKKLAWIQ
jgi:mutator protein MutT